MATEAVKRSDLPKLTYNEHEADQISGVSRYTRWRARRRGELRCVETCGRRVLYTLDDLIDFLNRRYEQRARKRKQKRHNKGDGN